MEMTVESGIRLVLFAAAVLLSWKVPPEMVTPEVLGKDPVAPVRSKDAGGDGCGAAVGVGEGKVHITGTGFGDALGSVCCRLEISRWD